MATYADLKTRFQNKLIRTDATTAQIDGYFQDAVDRVNRTVRHPSMRLVANLPVTSGAITLPADYLALRNAYFTTEELVLLPLARFLTVDPGTTKYYIRSGNTWKLKKVPADSTEVVMEYYAKQAYFASDGQTVPLNGDLFVYGALIHAAEDFLDVRQDRWEARFGQIVTEINADGALQDALEGPGTVKAPTDSDY